MRLYSDFGGRRTAQITGDILALGLIALSVWAAALVHGAVSAFASLGRQLEKAGNGFRGSMSDAGETLGDIPLICARELGITHGKPLCIRVLMHFNGDQPRPTLHHVYLEGARSLRDDLPE